MAHGRYTIVGKLADGGMAEIFLAMQHGAEGFQKPVVLKRVLSAFSADQQFRNMFLDEAHISMSLAHGNIVQVLDVGVSGERTFLVLELVEGWDLEQVISRAQATGPDHPWPPSLALYVTAQICRGLAYAHNKRGPDGRPLGIVHRDVSPNNVLISEQGEVKLADFGIAKAERKREQTLAGVIKGKVGFMSPEQALGRGLDARADLFSVGTVLYLMLTGQKPFEAPSELESMMKAQRGEYPSPEELNPYLSKDVAAIVNRAMRADPIARYQTAEQMLIDVERVLRAEYKSAGQTELKLWLAELSKRDGVLPMGRTRIPVSSDSDSAGKPMFIDESSDLSAGASVELSDIDGSSSPTAVSVTPITGPAPPAPSPGIVPARARIGDGLKPPPADLREILGPHGATTVVAPVRKAPTPAGTPSMSISLTDVPTGRPSPSSPLPAQAAPAASGAAAVASPVTGASQVGSSGPPAPEPPPAPRPARRSRVGMGFLLGAVCMLGAVFGIRWLAQWAGREGVGPTSWYRESTDAGRDEGKDAAHANVAPPGAAPPAAVGAGGAAATANATGGASGEASPAVQVAEVRDAGTGTASSSDAAAAVAELADDDEDRLLGRVRPDAAAVIGEDEAESTPQKGDRKGGGAASDGTTGKADDRSAQADKEKAKDKGKAARAAAARNQPVQIRITTSPLGAVVRSKKQVLGRTPLAIRFKPGSTYELTFVKSGYLTNSRRLAVSVGKPQSISVAMKKAPAPKRSFFGR